MRWTEYSSDLLRERYWKALHHSGLSVYVFPKRMMGTYALLATRYGSVDCVVDMNDGRKAVTVPDGIAHFLEHKMFENEDGSDSFSRFSAYGADANAYTTYHRTAYLFNCTDCFELSLEELLRFVYHPYFTEASVQKEQGIIAEEIRMYEDQPWERCYHNLLNALYWEHPVRQNICGTQDSIKKITPELLYACHRVFYHPSNMALVVCGDVTREQVMEVVERCMPTVEAPLPVLRDRPVEPQSVRIPLVRDRMQVAKPIFSIGIKDTAIPADPLERLRRDAAMTLLNEVLFSRSEPFYNELFESGILNPTFSFGYSCTESFAFNCISGESDTPELMLERLREYLDRVRRVGISDEAFERCRRVLYADEIRAYDSTEEISDRLLSFVFDDAEMFSYPTILQDVTKAELETLLNEAFQEEWISLSVIEPLETIERKEEAI